MSMKDFVDTLSDEQKQALLAALSDKDSVSSQMLPEEVNEETTTIITEDFRVQREPTEYSRRREPVRARENTWTDTGEAKDIQTPDVKRTPRTRKPPQKKSVQCSVCGKTNTINSSLVYGQYYRCDNCTG